MMVGIFIACVVGFAVAFVLTRLVDGTKRSVVSEIERIKQEMAEEDRKAENEFWQRKKPVNPIKKNKYRSIDDEWISS